MRIRLSVPRVMLAALAASAMLFWRCKSSSARSSSTDNGGFLRRWATVGSFFSRRAVPAVLCGRGFQNLLARQLAQSALAALDISLVDKLPPVLLGSCSGGQLLPRVKGGGCATLNVNPWRAASPSPVTLRFQCPGVGVGANTRRFAEHW